MSGHTLWSMVADIQNLASDGTIFAIKPWNTGSAAKLTSDEVNSTEPSGDYDYFIEVAIAAEFLEDFGATDMESRCNRLIQYAINDC